MNRRFLAFVAIGLVVVGAAVFWVFSSTKGAHLILTGEVLKFRPGALDSGNSAALIDIRLQNPSDLPFVVREVEVKFEKAGGETIETQTVAKPDLQRMLQYNRFLGAAYNDTISIRDRIPPHTKLDRTIAVTAPAPLADLEQAKAVDIRIEDLDGPVFELRKSLH